LASLKDKFIEKCPNWLFVPVANTYYSLVPKREKLKIKHNSWLIQKGGITLVSPTPKFLGFGLKDFKTRFERFFKIESGETVLDVGACIGDTTVPMAIKTGSTGKIIAVEPHPLNIKYLKLNLADFNNVEIISKALWNEKGTVKFNVHDSLTGHSILEDKERDSFIEVPSDTLDNLFGDRKIDFAKIDVQGAEVQVLEGGNKFLETIRKLAVETHNRFDMEKRTYPKVMETLKKYDFKKVRFVLDNGVVYAWR
jgi:FkbM family methyltransferase